MLSIIEHENVLNLGPEVMVSFDIYYCKNFNGSSTDGSFIMVNSLHTG